ncbi:mitochondrial import inner membrane translocase subunit tim54 [Moniliophthora roreri]|uniref:Mitochondrial import inner membrane translocase subunit TIM54 n=1 Tax=Moniliophthora roreri TaxID=221103 RepID=A0A0W0FPB9_MONRR|nr:mitochondrial import inner membrane translocase subunit tim54 [Moniliophthora roreri]
MVRFVRWSYNAEGAVIRGRANGKFRTVGGRHAITKKLLLPDVPTNSGMNSQDVETPSSSSTVKAPTKKSGIRAALEFTGIPPSWLDKRPKLPSRNWLIFWTITGSITGYYIYDRRQCKQIKAEYVEKVKYLSEESSPDHLASPRKVTVYGARWPGDEDWDQCIRYFRKYVKPIFVAAAIDYEMVVGKRHGDIAKHVAEGIRKSRRIDVGLDQLPPQDVLPPNYPFRTLAEIRQHRLEGGVVIVGRPTWKEFMAGLKRGWTDGLEEVDHEETLARELQGDGRFDEPEDVVEDKAVEVPEPKITPSNPPPLAALDYRLPQARPPPPPPAKSSSQVPDALNAPPPIIPLLPPILFVSFTNYLGFKQIPYMIWDFFNQRHKVRSGAEAGYRLVMNCTRPIDSPPTEEPKSLFSDITTTPALVSKGDLDMGKDAEAFYKKDLLKMPEEIEKERAKYYEALPEKLKTARALARGEREPTQEEINNPPMTEVELRADRMKKEKRWRADETGWDIVRFDKEVEWDEKMKEALRLFIDP